MGPSPGGASGGRASAGGAEWRVGSESLTRQFSQAEPESRGTGEGVRFFTVSRLVASR